MPEKTAQKARKRKKGLDIQSKPRFCFALLVPFRG